MAKALSFSLILATLAAHAVPPQISFTPAVVSDTVGVPATHVPTKKGSITSCTSSPALPAGFSLNGTTCTISGAPSSAQSSVTYTITAVNKEGSGTANLSLAILIAKPTISFIPDAVVDTLGKPASHVPFTAGTIYGCAVSPTLPAGYGIDNSTCAISGTATQVSPTQVYTVTASNTTGSGTATLSLGVLSLIDPPTVAFNPGTITDTLGKPASHAPVLSGGAPSTCSISPELPPGLTFSPSTCAISGIPTTVQASRNYTVTAGNSAGIGTATLNLGVIEVLVPPFIEYQSPWAYVLGDPIPENTPVISGGPITSFSISPSLPPGMQLDPITGVFSGAPGEQTPARDYTVTATGPGGAATSVVNFSVYAMPSSLSYAENPASYALGVPVTGNIPSVNGMITLYSVLPALPAGLTLDSLTGIISGTPLQAGEGSYTIVAENDVGWATTVVRISVYDQAPAVAPPAAIQKSLAVRLSDSRGFSFLLPDGVSSRVSIQDFRGRVVWSRTFEAARGSRRFSWDEQTSGGSVLPTGIYWVRIQSLTHAVAR